MANIDPRNPPNEFPDIVGFKPVNPILASFRPFIPPRARLRELTPLPLIIAIPGCVTTTLQPRWLR
jgi:hypothetical protein